MPPAAPRSAGSTASEAASLATAATPAPARTHEAIAATDDAAPPVALTLPPDSDLVLVETSHAAATVAAEEVAAPRPKRVRPPRVTVADEPLEIIETRKEPPAAA